MSLAETISKCFPPLSSEEISEIRELMRRVETGEQPRMYPDSPVDPYNLKAENGRYSIHIYREQDKNRGRYRLYPERPLEKAPELGEGLLSRDCPVLSPNGFRERTEEEFKKTVFLHEEEIARKMEICADNLIGEPGTNRSYSIGTDWELHAWIDGGDIPRFKLDAVIRPENEWVRKDLGVEIGEHGAWNLNPWDFGVKIREVYQRDNNVGLDFTLYGSEASPGIPFDDLQKNSQDFPEVDWEYGDLWARAEDSGSEGCYVEVARWDEDAKGWRRFAFEKIQESGFNEIDPATGKTKELSHEEAAEWLADRINRSHGNRNVSVIHSLPSYQAKEKEAKSQGPKI